MQVRIRPNNAGIERFRRGGVEFGRHFAPLDPESITDAQLSAIVNEPMLEVEHQVDGEDEPASKGGKPKKSKG